MSKRDINEIVASHVLGFLNDDPDALVEIAYEDDAGEPTKARMASRLAANIEGRVRDIMRGEVDDEALMRAIIRAAGVSLSEVRSYIDLERLVEKARRHAVDSPG